MSHLQDLFAEMTRLHTQMWNAVDSRLRAEFDLPLSRLEPMQVIARVKDCRVFDIASELSMTVGGTSKLVDRLEDSGLCVRRNNPADRRSSLILLTPEGTRLLQEATVALEDELSRLLGSTAQSTVDQFTATMRRLRAAADEQRDDELASA
jgi:DNA-binding MarR family transcriptional regulator